MKTIRVWADIDSTGLFDEVGQYFLQDETTISDGLWAELQDWVQSYEYIVPLSMEDRAELSNEIRQLDEKGMELLSKISLEWKNDIDTDEPLRFAYFSEGYLKVLS